VGHRAYVDIIGKRIIFFPCHGTNPDSSAVQPLDLSLYKRAIPALQSMMPRDIIIKYIIIFAIYNK
jgi:hypothetical protein